ncbi:hypothetical protein K438DRAFT_1993994 [Mycena galopus ATCC 62051]|nr:hypothetical protein K438DRAFT_1993994 [Mycena galopus ATCC 62051]
MEIEDKQDGTLPSLPWSSPYVMIAEVDFQSGHCDKTPISIPKSQKSPEAQANGDISHPAPIFHGEPTPPCQVWAHTISFGLLFPPRDQFLEDNGHPLALLMPGLIPWDAISSHSSTEQVSSMGDNNPNGLCEEALKEAICRISIRSSRVTEPFISEYGAIDPVKTRIHELRSRWVEACADLMGLIPLELPPLQEINHEINLVDELAKYNFPLPHCPEALCPELRAKIHHYTQAGWWEMTPVPQAAPLLCIPKKDNKLCTVVDACQRNDNMVKDVTPFPVA